MPQEARIRRRRLMEGVGAAPFRGLRLWFIGIGGVGMSALAIVTRAWGAEVGGWDRNQTMFLEGLSDVVLKIAPAVAEPPRGWEPIVSSAFADEARGKRRAELLADVVAKRPSVVVAGAHGKTTTTAMIAFCLDRVGGDPTFLIGGYVPQLASHARAGSGWIVAEGDESDRGLALLRPTVAVLTNFDLDHHATFASRHDVEEFLRRWATGAKHVVYSEDLPPLETPLAIPGTHNRQNAAAAVAALELCGVDPADARRAIARFTGVSRRLEFRGEARGVAVYDDYGHHPAEISATLEALREGAGGRVLALFQPHRYSRTRHLAHELATALSAASQVAVSDVYGANEEPLPGVTGKLIIDALSEQRPGIPLAWTPNVDDGARLLARGARPRDRILTIGAGDVTDAAEVALAELAGGPNPPSSRPTAR